MKKITQFLIVFLVALTLTSCAKQEINNGLYFIISLPLLGFAIGAGLKAWKGYNSGYTQQTTGGIVSGEKKVVPWGWVFFCGLLLFASIGSAKWIYEENRNYDPKKDGIPKEAPKDNRESAEEQARKADSVHNLKK